MIDRIKRLINAGEEIEKIKEYSKSAFSEARKEIGELIDGIKLIEKQATEKLKVFEEASRIVVGQNKQAADELKKTNEEFLKELNDFKLLKTKLRTDMVDKVCKECSSEIEQYIMNVKDKIDKLNDAAKEIKTVAENSGKILDTMDNIKEIGKSIRKEDFELSKHAEMLRKNDKEKLELLRKIDTLERLIAKQRRRN